jgi:tRNA(fMet)-specific endonuclease VapC
MAMDKVLLDTDMFSEILKGINPQVASRSAAYREVFGKYTISVITVMEIIKGLHKVQRESQIDIFIQGLHKLEVLQVDSLIAETAGRIYADLERRGQTIGYADPLIAATALHHKRVLVTGNQSHYQRIQALGYPLKLDNWR